MNIGKGTLLICGAALVVAASGTTVAVTKMGAKPVPVVAPAPIVAPAPPAPKHLLTERELRLRETHETAQEMLTTFDTTLDAIGYPSILSADNPTTLGTWWEQGRSMEKMTTENLLTLKPQVLGGKLGGDPKAKLKIMDEAIAKIHAIGDRGAR